MYRICFRFGENLEKNYDPNLRYILKLVFFTLCMRLMAGIFKSFAPDYINLVLSAAFLLPFFMLLYLDRWLSREILLISYMIVGLFFASLARNGFGVSGLLEQANMASRYALPMAAIYYASFEFKVGRGGEISYFVRRFLIISLSMIVISNVGVMLGFYREIQDELRLEFPFENPNTLGIFYAMTAWLAFLYHSDVNGRRIRSLLLLVYVLSIFLVIESGSLNGMAMVSLSFLYYFYGKRGFRFLKYLVAPFLVASLIYFVDLSGVLSRLEMVVFSVDWRAPSEGGSSLIWRLQTWIVYLREMTLLGWLVGNGPGVSRIWFESWAPGYANYSVGDIPGTHNDYLAVLFDFGFGGLVVLLILMFGLYKKMILVNFSAGGVMLISVAASMFFDNLLDSILMVYALYFFYPLYHLRISDKRNL